MDLVSHPPHYLGHPSGVECIELTEQYGFNIGNAIKYLYRHTAKGNPEQDLAKAVWYIEREIERISRPHPARTTGAATLGTLWERVYAHEPQGHIRDAYRHLQRAGSTRDPYGRSLATAAKHISDELTRYRIGGLQAPSPAVTTMPGTSHGG